MVQVFSFARRILPSRDWTNSELAELYRVEHALLQAGIAISSDRGVSDEGDPWFVFCGANDDVLIHIARIDGLYHLYSAALPEPLKGRSFTDITKQFVNYLPMRPAKGVVLHPAAIFGLLVATIFFAFDHMFGVAQASEVTSPASKPETPERRVKIVLQALSAKTSSGAAATSDNADGVALQIVVAGLAIMGLSANVLDEFGTALAATGTAPAIIAPVAASGVAVASQVDNSHPIATASTVSTASGEPGPSVSRDATVQIVAGSVSTSNVSAPSGPGWGVERIAVGPQGMTIPLANGVNTLAPQDTPIANQVRISSLANGETLVQGSGALTLSLPTAATTVVFDGAQISSLTIDYAASSNTNGEHVTLQLTNGASVALTNVYSESSTGGSLGRATNLDLLIESTGSAQNTVSLDPALATANLTVHIVGQQDLRLNEDAASLGSTSVDSSAFEGRLVVGVDLSSQHNAATVLNSKDFVVGNEASIVLLNVDNAAKVDVGINLNDLIVDMTPSSHSLALDLVPSSDIGVSLGVLKTQSVTNLVIDSGGAPAGTNTIGAILDDTLQSLVLTGSSSLIIKSFVATGTQEFNHISIDASQLKGDLQVDATALADVLAVSGSLTIKGSAGDNTITVLSSHAAVEITEGSGTNAITLSPGSWQTTLFAFRPSDRIIIGANSAADVAVDATHIAGLSQTYLDGLSVIKAAEVAAQLANDADGHQAILFNYNGNSFVFVDYAGDHAFNGSTDAIVKLIGLHTVTEIAGVFHSF